MVTQRSKPLVFTPLILLLALVAALEARAAAPRPLRIAFLFTSGTMASLWMAKESGAFAKEGLDVEMISMGSTLALPALIANEVDVIQVSAAPVITASLRGFDVVFIAGMLNTMIWDLYARPEIKSVEQLRGKIVGTDRPGSPVAYGTFGGSAQTGTRCTGRSAPAIERRIQYQVVSALQSGQIAAGAAAPPVSFHIERSGFHSLASTLDQPYQNVGLVIRRGRMNELAPRLVPLLRSVREGIDRFYADKPFTLKVIPKYTRDSDPDIIERTYEFYRNAGFRRELMISEPGCGHVEFSLRIGSGSEESRTGAILR